MQQGDIERVLRDASAADEIRCAPLPEWVVYKPYLDALVAADDAFTGNGTLRLLHDTQVDLSGVEQAWYRRTVLKVLTRQGAEQAAHFTAEFDAAFEYLHVHFIRLGRGGAWIDHARPSAFQTFRRETDLERRVLNGRLTASLLIPDVRIDDIVDIGYTLYSNNQVMGGKRTFWALFNAQAPWLETSHRQRRSLSRKLYVKSFGELPQPTVVENGGIERSCWRVVGQQPVENEEFEPPWVIPGPAVQCSEFESWGEVARLFTGLYDTSDMPASLVVELDRIATEHPSLQRRAAEWLRFVQRHVRYFAMALGEGGWVPRPLETIWQSRFGDCKDAARLYVAGARYLDLSACPTLVSTRFGPVLRDFLPSATIFDHVIVHLQIGGKSYWLDPTAQTQSGNLEEIYQPHFGWGLPLAADACQLESLGDAAALQTFVVEDVVEFSPKKEVPAKFTRQVEHRSWVADMVRNRVADEGTSGYAGEMLQDLRAAWPAVTGVAPVVVRDDPTHNRFTIVLSCEIPSVWKGAMSQASLHFQIGTSLLASQLGRLTQLERTSEIYLGEPRKLTYSARLVMPCKWKGRGWHLGGASLGIGYSNRLFVEGRTLINEKELLIERRSIPAAAAGDYDRAVASLHENVLTIDARERFGKIRPPIHWLPTLQEVALAALLPAGLICANWLMGDVVRSPNSAQGYYQRAIEYHADGQFGRAIQDLSQALLREPHFADAFDRRGVAYKNLGNYDYAIFDYNRAINLRPDVPAYYYNRGGAYYFKNQFDLAIRDYSEAIRLSPNANALINRARCYYAVARFREAVADYDEALRLDPRSELGYFNRATVRIRLGEYEAAIADYDAALKIVNSAMSLFGRGVAKRAIGDVAGGDVDIAAAKALDVDIAEAMANLKIIP